MNGAKQSLTRGWRLAALLVVVVLAAAAGARTAAAQQGGNQCGPPTVTVTAVPATPFAGQQVSFRYTATSGCPPGIPISMSADPLPDMQINFGDGTDPVPLDPPSGVTAHTYTVPGTYYVVVTATSAGRTGRAGTPVVVAVAPGPIPGPIGQSSIVALRATPQTVAAGRQVSFVGQVVSAQPGTLTASASLDFGDGQSVTPQTTGAGFIAQHAYTFPGTYAATLTVTNTAGGTAQATVTIIVVAAGVGWP